MVQSCGCATSLPLQLPLLVSANAVKPFISNSGKVKMLKKFQNSFFENPKKRRKHKYSAKVLSRKFHLNGYTTVHPQKLFNLQLRIIST